MYVQDIENVCSPNCSVALFADDCKFISNDRFALQNTLDSMTSFVATRQLVLAQNKCIHLPITRQDSSCQFYLEGNQITTANFVKDLGVTLTSRIKWKPHITKLAQKAFHTSHKILYSFSTLNIGILLMAYKTFVRPIVETNSVVWNPHLKENINKLESVQRFFTKRLLQRCGIASSSYEDRLSILNLKSLEHRRLVADLVMVFKIINKLVDIDADLFFTFKPARYNLRGHCQTLVRPKSVSNTASNFFTSRVIRLWNALPITVISSSSVGMFKFQINNIDLVQLKQSSFH